MVLKKLLSCVAVLMVGVSICAQNSFLVQETAQKDSSSKNELKEDVGEQLKQALYSCASITSQIAQMQIELAAMQKQLLANVEQLVENKKNFKHAKRGALVEAKSIMNTVKQELQVQETNIKKMTELMNKNSCLKS